jgi:hypothetical protein
MSNSDSDADLYEDIATDVLGVLNNSRFFERLDDAFLSPGSSQPTVKCGHSFTKTTEILLGLGMDAEEIKDVIGVLRSKGGCYDCEVLYNVAEESRLKSQYWKARANEMAGNQPRSGAQKTTP